MGVGANGPILQNVSVKTNGAVSYLKNAAGAIPGFSLCSCHTKLQNKNCILQRDLNSDRWNIK